jgi:hypothetical protein
MKSLFLVLGKLLGLLCLYWAVLAIPQLLTYAFIDISPGPLPAFVMRAILISVGLLSILGSCFLGVWLVFKTQRLADILRIPADAGGLPSFESESLLHVGIVLVGVYSLIVTLPELARLLLQSSQYANFFRSAHFTGSLAEDVLRLALALYLVMFPRHVMGMLKKLDKSR